ncbi:VOC family protein [Planctomonas sp. JC2975]|uniref:VOC family protein n=1 Tax=Planctomonas sp. JC2975 TaxID=2729626 RepID=UPI001476212B|nr:VOC family protein [Planctomonas sp. JC2975]NNC10367.1 VOC family protein [Planctomonas sp. JC2975]
MSVVLNPYLSFRDNARQAMEFYQSVFGGDLTVSTFRDFHMTEDESELDKVMHSQLTAPGGITLMGSDTPNRMEYAPGGAITVSLSGDDEPTLRRYWDGLSQGATITEPLAQAPWGDWFGMLVDRFGVAWMANISGQA